MPTNNGEVFELVQAISDLVPNLPYNGCSLTSAKRAELVRHAERLAFAAREPVENLYLQSTQTAQSSAIRTAINMGVFEKIPLSGSGINVTDLGSELGVDVRLLIRIMRALVSCHLFSETSPSHYTHNAFSSVFLIPANRDMFKQRYDLLGLGVYAMPRFLESTHHQNPTDYHRGAFQYGHRTDLGIFEYMKQNPERVKSFDSAMQSLAMNHDADAGRSAGAFPFDKEVNPEEIRDTYVVVVDVGGGRGQVLKAIHEGYPSLRGRMVLQDVPEVIEDAKASGLPSFIEPMAASFFEAQPVQGAMIYHFRRIFHNWSDDAALNILRNTVEAMSSRSRVLITDTVVPTTDVPRHVALMDINMMSFGGMERTQSQWEYLLERAGLKVKRFWVDEGDLQNTIEAVLSS